MLQTPTSDFRRDPVLRSIVHPVVLNPGASAPAVAFAWGMLHSAPWKHTIVSQPSTVPTDQPVPTDQAVPTDQPVPCILLRGPTCFEAPSSHQVPSSPFHPPLQPSAVPDSQGFKPAGTGVIPSFGFSGSSSASRFPFPPWELRVFPGSGTLCCSRAGNASPCRTGTSSGTALELALSSSTSQSFQA